MSAVFSIAKLADYGATVLLIGGLYLLAFFSLRPILKERRIQRCDELKAEAQRRSELVELLKIFGERVVVAQERQAEAMARMAECQARHDGATSESLDAVQIAISSVDQRAAALGVRTEHIETDVRELKTHIETMPGKVDEILQLVKGKGN